MFAVMLTRNQIVALLSKAERDHDKMSIAYFGSILAVMDAEELRQFDREHPNED